MGRILWYAGTSGALAAAVVVSAFSQRANFYSACIFMAQSNLCLMVCSSSSSDLLIVLTAMADPHQPHTSCLWQSDVRASTSVLWTA